MPHGQWTCLRPIAVNSSKEIADTPDSKLLTAPTVGQFSSSPLSCSNILKALGNQVTVNNELPSLRENHREDFGETDRQGPFPQAV